MPSAELLLRLLEEKDLVSPHVLQAARRELERTSPPPDAVALSLWLVQGQHITASQAERLLAAVMQETSERQPSTGRWQKHELTQPGPMPASMPPSSLEMRLKAMSAAHAPAQEPAPAEGQPPPAPMPPPEDLDLAPLTETGGAPHPAAELAPLEELDLAPLAEREGGSPSQAAKRTASVKKVAGRDESRDASRPLQQEAAALTTLGDILEPLEDTVASPMDSLLESEAPELGALGDSAPDPMVSVTGPRKSSFRRSLRNLFRRNRSTNVTVKAADPRHVKLVLFSWGVAFLAVIAAMSVFRFLSGRDAVDIRRDAAAAMEKGDYQRAIDFYNEFLESYSTTRDADDVCVLRIHARLRQAAQQAGASSNWSEALKVAQAQLKELPKSAKPELLQSVGNALASIAVGMARQVKAKPDEASVGRLQTIADLIENDIPSHLRPRKMLEEDVYPILKQAGQAVRAQKELDRTVDEIDKAVASADLPRAYAAYRNLLKSSAELRDHPGLIAAMKRVSVAQASAVKPGQQTLVASRTERPSDLIAAIPLFVQPVRGEISAARGKQRFLVDRGAVYALGEDTGKVLWRRFVARSPTLPELTALPVAEASGADVILCDPVHQELLRLKGSTGELVWRLAVGRTILAPPVRADKSLLLLTEQRRLLFVDLASGEAADYLTLPQEVKLPPIFDEAHGLVYLVADQSNIYALAGLKACQVLHLGHEAGTIAAVPAVVGDSLLVAVNDGTNEATLRVLSISASKGEPLQPLQRIVVKGYIDAPPVPMAGGAIVVTAQGGMVVLERNAADDKATFRVAASSMPELDERAVHFTVSDGHSLWVTGRQLTQFAVQSEKGQIVPLTTTDEGSRFIESPVIVGGTMFCVVQRPDLPGVTATAIDLAKNEPVWQTWLGAPLTASPKLSPDSGKVTVMTASGGMFRLSPAAFGPGALPPEPTACVESARLSKPLTALLPLPEERFAVSSGAETRPIGIYDSQADEKRFRWLVSPQALATDPAAFAGGVLAACANGQIFLLDPLARQDLAKHYEPKIEDVTAWKWQIPQPVDDKLAVLSDGDRRLIAIRFTGDAYPELAEDSVALSKNALVSPVAVLGSSVYVVDANDYLLSFGLPGLSPRKSQSLGGHCAWGPERVGDCVLVATEKQRLIAINDRQEVVWRIDLKYGPLAGAIGAGDDIYLASQSGIVARISAADGKERGKVDALCPLSTGPLPFGRQILVGGHDGCLLRVKRP